MSERKTCKVLGVEFEPNHWGEREKRGNNKRLVVRDMFGGYYLCLVSRRGAGMNLCGPNRRTKSAAYRALLALLSDDLKDKWPEVLRPPGERAKRGGK